MVPKKKCPPETLREIQGVLNARCEVDAAGTERFEACYSLHGAEVAGLELCARVSTGDRGRAENRMVVRDPATKSEGAVTCVHTAVGRVRPEDLEEVDEAGLLELAASTEGRPVALPPVEHFKSLASYTAGIAEMDLKDLLLATYQGDTFATVPFGLNAGMQKQLFGALKYVAPRRAEALARDLGAEVVASAPRDWVYARYDLLKDLVDLTPLCADAAGIAHAPDPVREFCAEHPTTPHAALRVLARVANWEDLQVLVENPNAKPALIAWERRERVAEHPATPPATLATLAGDVVGRVRESVAQNPKTPPATLAALAGDEFGRVRERVAEHPATPPDLLTTLAGDEDEDVRHRVAWSLSAPPSLLTTLAGDDSAWVRFGVAENPATPPALLATLAGDEDEDVRHRVAENPATPPALLATLAGDEDEDVRLGVAQNPKTPPDFLTTLAGDEDEDVRLGVAENPATQPAALATLAGDEDEDVRHRVAQNPKTPPDLLATLAGDEDSNVRMAAQRALAAHR